MNSPTSSPPQGFFKRLLHRMGQIQSALLLSLLYAILWLPVGLLSRLMADWLRRKPPKRTAWLPRSERVNRPETLREAF